MTIWPILIFTTLFSFAQEPAVQEYCFPGPSRMTQVLVGLKFILVPSDEIQKSDNCFTIKSSPHRRELIQNYVRKLEPNVQISFSSAEIKRDPCRLKVERIKKLTVTSTEGVGSFPSTGVTITASGQNKNQQGKDVLTIQTLQDFELVAQQNVIKGLCKALTPNRYEITLEVRKDPLNNIPQLPPGTIINQSALPTPNYQDGQKIVTSLQLASGQKIEIGNVIKELKEKNGSIDIDNGINGKQSAEESTEQVFLSIE